VNKGNNMPYTVAASEFVRRQVIGSGKTYSKMSFEEIADFANKQLVNNNYKKGYRDGVVLIPVSDHLLLNFICPLVKIDENTILQSKITRRRPDESPYIQIRALNGNPLRTKAVDLILYRNDVLAESNEQETDADWELISFHAIPEGVKFMPMGPVTMMRNQLQLTGGTKGAYSRDDWAKSVQFWQQYAVLSPGGI